MYEIRHQDFYVDGFNRNQLQTEKKEEEQARRAEEVRLAAELADKCQKKAVSMQKVMKIGHVSFIAKRRYANVNVFFGKKQKTALGLTKDGLMKNKPGMWR